MSLLRAGPMLSRSAATVLGRSASGEAICLMTSRVNSSVLSSLAVAPKRFFSVTSKRFYDEFVKKKSEYRMPGISDSRVRERHALIPAVVFLFAMMLLNGVLAYFCYD